MGCAAKGTLFAVPDLLNDRAEGKERSHTGIAAATTLAFPAMAGRGWPGA